VTFTAASLSILHHRLDFNVVEETTSVKTTTTTAEPAQGNLSRKVRMEYNRNAESVAQRRLKATEATFRLRAPAYRTRTSEEEVNVTSLKLEGRDYYNYN
jgi:hypothetical protein